MLKQTITYTDYNGTERTEDFYFNLSKTELMEMEMGTAGGYTEMVNRIVASQDGASIIKIFKDLVLKAYGVKSVDGKKFIKIDENGHNVSDDFAQTEAYSELFMRLITDAEAAAAFVNGIIPKSDKEDNIKKLPNSNN